MTVRNVEARLSRLESASPEAEPYIIAGENIGECHELLAQAVAKGLLHGRRPMLVATGVPSWRGS